MSAQLSLFSEDSEGTDLVDSGDAAPAEAAPQAVPSAAAPGKVPAARVSLRRKAQALFESGCGYRRVAADLDLSIYTVREWSKSYKKGNFSAEPSRRVYSEEDRARIMEMSASGLQPAEIARRLQIPARSVRSILARNRGKADAAD